MSDIITRGEYFNEVASLAKEIIRENKENDGDDDTLQELLHQTIDGHQWVIYYGKNIDILRHTENDDYADDNGCVNNDGKSIREIIQAYAFWAMFADVGQEILDMQRRAKSNNDDQDNAPTPAGHGDDVA